MKYIYTNFKVSLTKREESLSLLLAKKLYVSQKEISQVFVAKQSVDARHKDKISISYNLIFDASENLKEKFLRNVNVKEYLDKKVQLEYPTWDKPYRPIVVGFGPSGIFAALYLARCHANPIILERGSDIDTRIEDVKKFIENKELNESSNIQFGEGGAGTFSDGKLTTNLKDDLIVFITQEFVKYGATKEILYESTPHIGTDYLRVVIKNMRLDMIKLGASFYFNTKFLDYEQKDDHLQVFAKGKEDYIFNTGHLILGLGHSSRDTLQMLYKKGLNMEAKSFSMGVRIEHKKEKINQIQYGKAAKLLPPAAYKMAVHLKDRSVYTFCMCPGGEVMCSASEKNSIVTNGMSYHDRGLENSNAALLVNVDPKDFVKDSIMDGLSYQEKYEQLAFNISKDYRAPSNLLKEFMEGEVANTYRSVRPSYPHGIVFSDLSLCLPPFVISSLREAIPLFDKKMKGFNDPDAILTGVETRSSCPVRILRDENRVSSNKMIYPIGEGAGYAGGITSAALDGLKTAMSLFK